MTKDTVVAFRAPDGFSSDPLTDLLRQGARELIAQAVEAELNVFLAAHADQTDAAGRRRLVRHGHLPERDIQTGIGAVAVQVPRVRDRAPEGTPLKFTSTILPPYLRRAKSIEELLPWLYLKGISTGDFSEALAALLGPDAPGLSASTVTRLKAGWWEDYERWSGRDLSARRYVYFWADGVYFTPRMDEDRQCMLVIIGAPLVVCLQTTTGNRRMGQQGCAGPARRLSREHPELARAAAGPETPGSGGRTQAGCG